ncbi:hypothetical protein [Salisaeta longa]|uniref:hypothetical protein n=1 Tax=Salisaeta longa TaxID=503170 RepID=UPI0003B5B482|nr:hypothetical protein [Salisaeta longa]
MRKKTFIATYTIFLVFSGVGIIYLGLTFDGIRAFSNISGAQDFTLVLKFIGAIFSAAGFGGLIWALTLNNNTKLPGYAGLNFRGIVTFTLLFFIAGPFWLLIAWVLWFIPGYRSRNAAAQSF